MGPPACGTRAGGITSPERSASLCLLRALLVEQVSVKSDLEAKTVEVVGNAGPFEVRVQRGSRF